MKIPKIYIWLVTVLAIIIPQVSLAQCTIDGQPASCGHVLPILGAIFIPIIIIVILGTIFWIWMLVDVVERPIPNKTPWVIVVVLGHLIGAAIYYFVVRRRCVTENTENVIQDNLSQQSQQPVATPQNAFPTSGLAITSLVLGIISIFSIPFLGLIIAILSVIFGVRSRKKIKTGLAKGDGISIAGVILGCVGIVLGVLSTLPVLFILFAFLSLK